MEAQEIKNLISNILHTDLNYAYCDNCGTREIDKDGCEDCHRKYQNWCLAKHTSDDLADKILNIFKETNTKQNIKKDIYGHTILGPIDTLN